MPINCVRNSMNLNYTFYGNITKNYGWELDFFRKVRRFSDGISFFDFKIVWDRYESDHTPRFNIGLYLLNLKLFEFSIYYLFHR